MMLSKSGNRDMCCTCLFGDDIDGSLLRFYVQVDAAKVSLADMPPRSEGELDPVTLHNVALMRMDEDPNVHLPKLNFLMTLPSRPLQTFANLLLLYCKYQYYDVAADVLAENNDLIPTQLDPVCEDRRRAALPFPPFLG